MKSRFEKYLESNDSSIILNENNISLRNVSFIPVYMHTRWKRHRWKCDEQNDGVARNRHLIFLPSFLPIIRVDWSKFSSTVAHSNIRAHTHTQLHPFRNTYRRRINVEGGNDILYVRTSLESTLIISRKCWIIVEERKRKNKNARKQGRDERV